MRVARTILLAIGLATLAMTPATAQDVVRTNGRAIATLAQVPIETRDGEPTRFGSRVVAGKPTLVAFWASWCLPCVAEAPYLNRLRRAYGDRFTFLYVNRRQGDPDPDQPPWDIARFLRRAGMSDVDYIVADTAASRRILGKDALSVPPGKVGIPRVYLFDRNGRQIYAALGFSEESGATLDRVLREAVTAP